MGALQRALPQAGVSRRRADVTGASRIAGAVSRVSPHLCLSVPSLAVSLCSTPPSNTGEEGDEWLAPTLVRNAGEKQGSSTQSSGGAAVGAPTQPTSAAACDAGDDDVPDISELALEDTARGEAALAVAARGLEADEEDSGVLRPHAQPHTTSAPRYLVAHEPDDVIMRTRTYDVSITFDKYYATPRIWLVGYSESRQPLSAEECLEDVSVEHARKTVTVDSHPHTGVRAVSIHPCKHAAVMKSLAEQLSAGGKQPKVEHFLLIFLRFCQTVRALHTRAPTHFSFHPARFLPPGCAHPQLRLHSQHLMVILYAVALVVAFTYLLCTCCASLRLLPLPEPAFGLVNVGQLAVRVGGCHTVLQVMRTLAEPVQ